METIEYLTGKEFSREYVRKTLALLKQYERSPEKEYDTTLLCNCLLGLMIVPSEDFYKNISDDLLSVENLTLLRGSVEFTGKSRGDLAHIICCMRSAVKRGNVRFTKKETFGSCVQIRDIAFYDDNYIENKADFSEYEFRMKIGVEMLRKIIIEFCENIVNEVSRE